MSILPSLSRWNLTDRIPRHMPILDRWLERAAQDRPLAGVTALLIQHQLGNHVPLARALLALGIAPRDLYWIDIPYTSTAVVREAVHELGVPEKNMMVRRFHLLNHYTPFQRLRVQRFLRRILEDPPARLLVLDDGSYMLEALACMRLRPPSLAIVEQTTQGLIKIEESAALEACAQEFPVVNVARSRPKATLEPLFIGVAVCDALRRSVGSALHVGPRDHCLVLGYGAIGRQVAEFAHQILGFPPDRVHVHDPAPERMHAVASDGFTPWARRNRDVRFTLVLGCSGRASFTVGDHVLLEDGAFLASATSGTVELSREAFIELADASPHDDIEILRAGLDEFDVHSNLHFRFIDREATFVNGGFPVNFDGRVNCVPAHYIQPTPTMMCAAAVQAAQSTAKGLIDLDHAFGCWLDAEFRSELGDEASLLPT
jgi:S-adenosylhomocysteine hydrolase